MPSESKSKRKYKLKKRAATMAKTRERIARAAAELHEAVGPARTSLSAVAERAGVQRHTLYRHFPTEAELFGACSAHYFTANPLPDLAPWRELSDPKARLQHALDALYAYYQRTEGMFSNVLRDAEVVEALGPTLAPMQEYLAEATRILTEDRPNRSTRQRRLLVAATRHALDFRTWRSLTEDTGLSHAEAIELAVRLVAAAEV